MNIYFISFKEKYAYFVVYVVIAILIYCSTFETVYHFKNRIMSYTKSVLNGIQDCYSK